MRIKKLLSVMLAVALLFSVIPITVTASAETTSGTTGDCTWTLDGTHLTISGNGDMNNYWGNYAPWGEDVTSVTIEQGVTSIGLLAFKDCKSLTSVTIPDSVTSIGWGAFEGCAGLTGITMPDSMTSIEWRAFHDCTSLTNIAIPDDVTYIGSDTFCNTAYYNNNNNWFDGVLYISNHLIANKDNVNGDYTIRQGTKCISCNAFYGCTGLTSITIPDSVTSIGSGAFGDCTGLTSITIPNSVTNIGSETFMECTGLASITIPDSVTGIGGGAFYNTAYYNNNSNWFDGVLYIGNHLIDAKEDIVNNSYTIRQGTKCVAGDAFSDCARLTSVTIPGSVTSIGRGAFYGCTGLTSITIPDSVTSIGDYAFCGCVNLSIIMVDENNKDYCSVDGALYNKDKTSLIICPAGQKDVFIIPDSVTEIGDYALEGCKRLTSITIPNSVTSIGAGAFCDCTSLTSITIPDSVTRIGDWAFGGCSNLVIKTHENSAAHKYALENDIDFEIMQFAEKLGDVNGDGGVTIKDAIAILRHNAEVELLTGSQIIAGDLNGDGSVNTKDAILLLQYNAQIIDKFPIE